MSVTSSKTHSEKVTFGGEKNDNQLTGMLVMCHDTKENRPQHISLVFSQMKNYGAVQGPGIHQVELKSCFFALLFKTLLLIKKATWCPWLDISGGGSTQILYLSESVKILCYK